ncbi:uncharacterized protein LOC125224221 isoform X2 [Salvia hispanica]|uniref:uncharacterized protein LOC125224221 isoform X2 n=1 Tax=Salvia hispanica TaxID=49212 RepID=UPI0020090663|nr:uncharacterized protein LOC125224221 isoform X2 [Salvia hispanica]
MQFVYILPGWEGSAGDSRVLRDALSRPNGFRVPQGCYYLCDSAYANCPGFLTPYKGVRYHLKEWGVGDAAPHDPKELFNMRHSKARNIIERAFAVLKMRWGEMSTDPVEIALDVDVPMVVNGAPYVANNYVDCVDPSPEWTALRDAIAQEMWNTR